MRNSNAKNVALGGVLAALAVVVMCLGGLIPVATYVCPVLCALLLSVVLRVCGVRIAWAWFGAVALLSLLLGPDKEACAVFFFLGYYPIIKPKLDRSPLRILWKAVLFNGAATLMYVALIWLFGMAEIASELRELGLALGVATLILGNVTFFLLDRVLTRMERKR